MIRSKKLTIYNQLSGLKKDFGFGESKIIGGKTLQWVGILKSSPIGDEYKVKLTYELGENPNVFVQEPAPLKLAKGETVLPHIYNHKKQHLCLYNRKWDEWNSSKPIAQTVMIWAIEWLYHYELWLITGEWLGGGTVHGNSKK
ncbi:hypothetical protein [Sphingobacterium yanglingense]|uniref:Type II CBASS E2 protein domain-containing protein n=1 Tax=Sphingobacterium yanglingense TaxID=1437280 RepID=A0A4R6WEU1_9SPHI|nr:hypothetical protein [Sphingobacterium yanglingense]TDQ78332.1 hypothetical protein CLV99_2315 [Sphingobacterium yanglingense]